MLKISSIFQKITSSLKYRNFRLYIAAQFVSITGSWVQAIALNWLAYEITGSAETLGIITALQFLPLLVFGIFGGHIVDSLPKYKTVLIVQFLQFLMPFFVACLLFTGGLNIYFLYASALWAGMLRVIDAPVRQSLRYRLIPKSETKNAISLFSTINGLGRIIGPIISGIVLAAFGAAWCFLLNACSFLAAIFLILKMNKSEFNQIEKNSETEKEKEKEEKSLIKNLKEIWRNLVVRDTLLLLGVVGTFILIIQTLAPIFIKQIFSGNALSYATIITFYSVGCVLGGIYGAQDRNVSQIKVKKLGFLLIMVFGCLALPLTFPFFLLFVLLTGFLGILMGNTANALVMLNSKEKMLGLVTSLWSMAIIGTGSIGGLYVGFMSERFGVKISTIFASVVLCVALLLYSCPPSGKGDKSLTK